MIGSGDVADNGRPERVKLSIKVAISTAPAEPGYVDGAKQRKERRKASGVEKTGK
jgi:hypothetical protein